MRKEEAMRILTSCAKQYSSNLVNRNLLFLFSADSTVSFIKALFLPKHFLHLTGVELLSPGMGASDFYRSCLSSQLSPGYLKLARDGTTEMKLSVLPTIMNIQKTAKMVGEYDMTKTRLFTEKIIGTVTACLGFVREGDYYIPNTVLPLVP